MKQRKKLKLKGWAIVDFRGRLDNHVYPTKREAEEYGPMSEKGPRGIIRVELRES